ncbi:phosphopantetheine-binding protein [Allokutzneria sp. A3M-2-11 16]|uniref:phosphopantetheine-binding protein n=1 Tax=Allokutzneria sp. A3M-2-11 16 TaxID=2962043 RepID=UPI0020B7CCF9|nr:phosphopantetheine-binding protein [Allokutzneria sp. A3M-2-11 16]MCP3799389.1 phosphopantetheine-binding protein [Allokutzneria sp. A3M-2-11 16]
MTSGTPITADDVRRLLSERKIFPELPERLADDTPVTLDSMGLIWFLHQLTEQHGVRIEPTEAEFEEFTSVGAIVAYLARKVPDGT